MLDCDPEGSPEALLLGWLTRRQSPQSFNVIHQGLVPGGQTIDRAELCALLQVCHNAANMPDVPCTAWTDSQYALDAVEKWQEQNFANGEALPTNFDLFEAMQVPFKPMNLTLRKIRAHTDATAAPLQDVRHVLGNAAADSAADMARKQDFPFVLDLVDEVYDYHCTQKENFLVFCRYQMELTRHVATAADARLRETALDATTDGANDGDTTQQLMQRWLARSIGGPERVPPMELPATWPRMTRWPQWFLTSLWLWRCSLVWPEARIGRLLKGEGITFLELLLNYVVVVNRLPPVASCTDGSLIDPLSADGILRPLTLRELVANFASATDFLTRACEQPFWSVPRHHRIFSLTLLGERSPRKGLSYRPGMMAEEATAQILVDVIQNDHAAELVREFALRSL